MSRDEAYRLMDTHQARGYLAHRLILSPADGERPADLRELTRHLMAELEKEKGMTLHWIAVEHRNTDHPHVHIVLCGGGGDENGAMHEVRLDRDDHARLRADGREYCRTDARERTRWETMLARAAAMDEQARGARDDRDR